MTKKPTLGKVELEILQAVERLQPVSVRQLSEDLSKQTGQARTTILTMLERLRRKGFVTRRKTKGINHYTLRQPIADVLPNVVSEFVQNMLGGEVSPVVAYLQNQKLDADEVAQLKKLIGELDEQNNHAGRDRK